jgi:hypothetical protein
MHTHKTPQPSILHAHIRNNNSNVCIHTIGQTFIIDGEFKRCTPHKSHLIFGNWTLDHVCATCKNDICLVKTNYAGCVSVILHIQEHTSSSMKCNEKYDCGFTCGFAEKQTVSQVMMMLCVCVLGITAGRRTECVRWINKDALSHQRVRFICSTEQFYSTYKPDTVVFLVWGELVANGAN